jgi:hypothetical protein
MVSLGNSRAAMLRHNLMRPLERYQMRSQNLSIVWMYDLPPTTMKSKVSFISVIDGYVLPFEHEKPLSQQSCDRVDPPHASGSLHRCAQRLIGHELNAMDAASCIR